MWFSNRGVQVLTASATHDAPPSAWVRRFLPLIRRGGRVLDLAAGAGRHTRLLRAEGFSVVAVDRDTAALEAALAVDPGCRIIALDLEAPGPWQLGGGYDGVVVTNYLHRPLLEDLAVALAILSAHTNRPLPPGTFAVGELGLGGEVRSVPQLEVRLREASRLGVGHAIVPHVGGNIPKLGGMALHEVRRLNHAMDF